MWKIIFLTLLFFIGDVVGQTKYFLPVPVESSNGRPIKDKRVELYQGAVRIDSLLWLDSGWYYYTDTSTVAQGVYDIYVNTIKWRTNVWIAHGAERFSVRGQDLEQSAKDTIAAIIEDSLDVATTDWQSDIKDSLDKANIIDSDQYIDNSIDYDHLSTDVQNRLSAENLYDYQDASVNAKLQMLVRYAHYLHEKYYNESDISYHWDYDETGSTYLLSRRGVVNYIKLLMVLHELTERDIYWYRMVDLYTAVRDSTRLVDHNVTAGRSARTVSLHPNVQDTCFTHYDVPFHLVGLYLGENDATYSAYYDDALDFADVLYSYITKSGQEGWGWGYKWTSVTDTTNHEDRCNTSTPPLQLYAQLKADNITTTDITTTATYDSLIDSVYQFREYYTWVDTLILGYDMGAWKIRSTDEFVDFSYSHPLIQYMDVVETLGGDTSLWTGFNLKMQKNVYYMLKHQGAGSLILERLKYTGIGTSLIAKIAQKYGLSFFDDDFSLSWVASTIYPSPFGGDNYPGMSLSSQRRGAGIWFMHFLQYHLKHFNDNSYSETFNYQRAKDWSTSGASWYLVDGHLVIQDYWLGTGVSSPYMTIGFRTTDGSPVCPDSSNWTYTESTKTVKIDYPAQANGLTYEYYHTFGTPYCKVVPSTSDSLGFRISSPTATDSIMFFFYDTLGVLDSMENNYLSVGDSFTFDGALGLYANQCMVSAPSSGKKGLGFITHSDVTMKVVSDDDTYRLYSTTTLLDSAYIFYNYHEQSEFFLTDVSDWTYALNFVRDILEHANIVRQNDMDYIGILEDKTQ